MVEGDFSRKLAMLLAAISFNVNVTEIPVRVSATLCCI
jgi:hypothetical protein